jgi:hypothetical protein
LRFLGIVDKRTMGHLNASKIGLDTDEEDIEELKPKLRKGQVSKEPLKTKVTEKL